MNSIEEMQLALLEAKERRQFRQRVLLEEFDCTLVSFTLNIPGIEKDSPLYRKAHQAGIEELIEQCPKEGVLYIDSTYHITGTEGYICLDMRAANVKRLCVGIESRHPLGRLFDMDVIDGSGRQIGRSDLNLQTRKCLMCNKAAHECARNQTHGMKHLIDSVNDICREYFKNDPVVLKTLAG